MKRKIKKESEEKWKRLSLKRKSERKKRKKRR